MSLSPETLLAHRQFLEGLSRALTSDPAAADDLLQETWLAALRRPPRERSTARAWLARVMRNAAATERRRAGRRRRREREAAARESLPSVAELAEREAVARRVIDLVFELDEPYASVVLHRFYDELSPREIARRQGVPVETVRTRLRRGLERLRLRLDGAFGDRGAWTVALLPLAGPPLGPEGLDPSSGSGSAAASFSGTETAAAGTQGGALSTAGAGAGSQGVLAGSSAALGLGKIIATGGIMTSAKVLGVSAAATLVAVFVTSAYVKSEADTEIFSLRSERDSLAAELARTRDEMAGLAGDLASARSRADRLADRLRSGPGSAGDGDASSPAVLPPAEEAIPSEDARPEEPVFALGSPEEADAILASLREKGDIEGLWLLAFELLGHGEAGYEKVLEIAERLDRDAAWLGSFRALWHREEQLAGAFVRDTGAHAEEILRFGLYLAERAANEKVPGILRELEENNWFFLGLYPGDDPEILGGYTDLYRRRLSGEIAPADRRRSQKIGRDLQALSYIPTDEATDVILDVLDRSPSSGELRKVAITALAWQRNPRAVPKLRALLATETDSKLREVLEAAVRFVE